MARYVVRMTASKTQESVALPFNAAAIAVSNPTASPLYIRVGAPDIPSSVNADLILPASNAETFPTNGRSFGLAVGTPSALQGTTPTLSGLFSVIIVTFLSEDEKLPSYGAYSFQSLSLSDLAGGFQPYAPGTTLTFDLGPWGGAMLMFAPVPGSGQGILNVEASASPAINFLQVGMYSVWPNVPVTMLLPRPLRYMRITVLATGIAGEPAPSGFLSARATISEIQQLTYNPVGTAMTVAYNIANLGSTSKILSTVGLQSISISMSNTTGNNNGELLIESAQVVGGPWQVVAFREQIINPAGGTYASIFRTYGNLGPFTRVTLLSTGVSGAIAGNLYFSITPQPDLNGILQQIYSALGDVGNTVNTDQSIFHLLAHMRASISNIEIYTSYDQALANIEIYTNTAQSKLTSMQSLENTNLPYLPNLTNLAGMKTDLDSMLTLENANLPSLPGIKSDLDSLLGFASTTGNSYLTGAISIAAPSPAQFTNLLLPYIGQWIETIQWGLLFQGVLPGPGFYTLGLGTTTSGPLLQLATAAYDGVSKAMNFPEITFQGTRSPGVLIQAGFTTVYVSYAGGVVTSFAYINVQKAA